MTNISRKFISMISPKNHGEKVYFTLLKDLKKNTKSDPQLLLETTIKKLAPGLKLLPQVKSGKVIYYPSSLSQNNSVYLAIKWLIKGSKERDKRSFFTQKLITEVFDTLDRRGLAYKSRLELTKMLLNSRVLIKYVYEPENITLKSPIQNTLFCKLTWLKSLEDVKMTIPTIKKKLPASVLEEVLEYSQFLQQELIAQINFIQQKKSKYISKSLKNKK